MANNVDIFINGKTNLPDAADRSANALVKLRNALEGGKHSLREWNALLEIGFGVGIGAKVFEKIHEGIMNVYEGFSEASEKGYDFVDSLDHGLGKLLGYKTAFDYAADSAKHFKEIVGDLPKSIEALQDSIFIAKGGAHNPKYPLLPPDVEAKEKSLQAELDRRQMQLDEAGYFEKKRKLEGYRKNATTATGRALANAELYNLDQEYGATTDRLGAAQSDLFAFRNEAARMNKEATERKKISDYNQSLYPDTRQALLNKLRLASVGILGGALGSVIGPATGLLGGIAGGIEGAVTRGAAQNSLRGQIADLQQQIKEANYSPAGTVGAFNSRFLTRGSGSKSLEAIEAAKTNKHLEDMKRKLADLVTALGKFTAAGVITSN